MTEQPSLAELLMKYNTLADWVEHLMNDYYPTVEDCERALGVECTTCGSEAVLNDDGICEVCFNIQAEEEQQARDFWPAQPSPPTPPEYMS